MELPLTNSHYVRAASLLALALVAYAQLAAPAGSEVRPSDLFFPFFCYPPGWTMTIFLMIVLTPADRRDFAILIAFCAAIGAGAGLAAEDRMIHAARDAAVMAGLAPYAFTLARIARASGPERSRWIDLLAVASLVHVTSLCIPYFRDNTAIWLPRILDADIASLDEAFGSQPSALMAIAFLKVPPLATASLIVYTFVQLPITAVAAWQWKRKATDELSVLPAFMIGSIVGFTCYWLAPAIGPKVYFAGRFPLLHATQGYLDHLPLYDFNPHHPRNDMPSMHFSWAVMAFLFTRGFPLVGRFYAALFVFFTFCATIGLGEHYLADLIVGASLVLMVRGLTAARLRWRDPDRLRAVVIGFAMLSAWIAAIHFEAPIPAPLTLLLFLGTVAAAIVFERALARAEGGKGRRPRRGCGALDRAVSRSARRQRRECSEAPPRAKPPRTLASRARAFIQIRAGWQIEVFEWGRGRERSFFQGSYGLRSRSSRRRGRPVQPRHRNRAAARAGHRPGPSTYIRFLDEVRVGVYAHNWIHDENSPVDVSAELLTSPIGYPENIGGKWFSWFFNPRINLGAMINTGGKTSYGFAGLTWRIPIYQRFFFEGEFGGAVNTSPLRDEPDRINTGCRWDFRELGGFGYQFNEHVDLIVNVEHISHASLCTHINPGMTQVGARIGYRF